MKPLQTQKIYSEFTGDKFIGLSEVGVKFTVYDISGKFLELEKGKRILQQEIKEKIKFY